MGTIESAVRDLAQQAGYPEIPVKDVRDIARKASEQYVDAVLDRKE